MSRIEDSVLQKIRRDLDELYQATPSDMELLLAHIDAQAASILELQDMVNAAEERANERGCKLAETDQERKDLAMLVRRLCYAMSKTATHAKLQEQALDYLKRKGLQGDILRGNQDV